MPKPSRKQLDNQSEQKSISMRNKSSKKFSNPLKLTAMAQKVSELETSKKILDQVSTWNCGVCGNFFFCEYGLNKHIVATGHSIETKEVLKCTMGCEKTFIYTSSLRRHYKEKHGLEKPTIRKSDSSTIQSCKENNENAQEEEKSVEVDPQALNSSAAVNSSIEPRITCCK